MIRLEQAVHGEGGFRLSADFDLPRATLAAVMGASGAGKSTLLSLIAGFERLDAGRLFIGGSDMTDAAPAARPVSMVFQDHNAFAHLDAFTNVALGVSPSLRLDGKDRASVDAALARVGLAALAKRKPGEMSGGELQRVALARVLVREKPVLLLDEPFAALDPGLRKEMLGLVAELHHERGLTTLLVTHQPEDARAICGQVIFVDKGEVRKPVETETFFRTDDAAVKAYLGQ